jgi:hypothetical protein
MAEIRFKHCLNVIIINLNTVASLQYDIEEEIITVTHVSDRIIQISCESDSDEWNEWLMENTQYMIKPEQFDSLTRQLFNTNLYAFGN